jgi:phosphoglycerol transferase
MRFFLYMAASVLVGLGLWCRRTFGQPTIEQILYHLEFSDPAAFQMSELFLLTFAAEVIGFPLLFAIAATCIHHLLVRAWPGRLR